jgi:hypothetical protein
MNSKKGGTPSSVSESQWSRTHWTEGLSIREITSELRRRKHQRPTIYQPGEVPEDVESFVAKALGERKRNKFRLLPK